MANPTVYIETTIVSYLTSRRSRDLIISAHQKQTRDWWRTQRASFDLHTSEVVVLEASAGDPTEAAKRVTKLRELPLLNLTERAEDLGEALVNVGPIPPRSARDALHVAIAAVNGMDYLLTWNCTHLANAALRAKIEYVCDKSGFRAPIICTPEELSASEP